MNEEATSAQPIPDTQPRPVPPVEGLAPGPVSAWIAWAVRHLDGASPSARADAETLMAAQLGVPRAQLLLRADATLLAAQALQFASAVERRRVGEPVAYITGRQGFWTLELEVDPSVLIPRADTETLVEWALELIARSAPGAPAARIADLGTGSGAIALALARERPGAQIAATDRSEAALAVARRNAQACGLDFVAFHRGDWFEALRDQPPFDLIVSNPPYIPEADPHLPDLRYEPRLALTSGADGLEAIRVLVRGAPLHLSPGGWLLIEHGYDQGEAVRALFIQAGWSDVTTRRDLGGHERVTGGRRA